MDQCSPAHKQAELKTAVLELRERGLYHAAKWAAEQLAGAVYSNSCVAP